MQPKFRLYRRSSRSNGTYYAQDSATGARESLGTKIHAEAEKLLEAKNEAHAHPTLSRELAKVYVQAEDPQFGQRTWSDVARLHASQRRGLIAIDQAIERRFCNSQLLGKTAIAPLL